MKVERRKALCFLCYKQSIRKPKNTDGIHTEVEADEDEDNSYKLTANFVRFFSRYLNVRLTNEDQQVLTEFLAPCDSCSNLIQEFCKLFASLEILQLQLRAKVERIYETINYAGRVPAGVDAFRKQFAFEKTGGNGKIGEEDGRQVLSQIDKLRNKFIKNYQVKAKKCSQPKVSLERIQNLEIPRMDNHNENEKEMPKQEIKNVPVEEEMEVEIDNDLIIKCEEVQSESLFLARLSSPEPNSTNQSIETDSSHGHGVSSYRRSSTTSTFELKRRTLKCEVCKDKFINPFHLRRHMKDAHDQKAVSVPLECSYCPKKFAGGQLLQRFRQHMRRVHKLGSGAPGKFPCHICNEKYGSAFILKTHIAHAHDPKKRKRDICQKYYRTKYPEPTVDELEMERSCQECGKICETVTLLKSHLKKECYLYGKNQKIVESDKDKDQLLTEDAKGRPEDPVNGKVHIEPQIQITPPPPPPILVAEPKRLLPSFLSNTPKFVKLNKPRVPTCRICRATFKHPMDVRQHMKTKHEQIIRRAPLECCYCNRSLRGGNPIELFRKHMNNFHKTGSGLPGEFECEICHEKFIRLQSHHTHMERAHNPNLMCEICQKMFDTKGLLETHKIRVHYNKGDKERGSRCGLCWKICKDEEALEKHLRTECVNNCPRKSPENEKGIRVKDGELISHKNEDDDQQVEFVLPDDILPRSTLDDDFQSGLGSETDCDFPIKREIV